MNPKEVGYQTIGWGMIGIFALVIFNQLSQYNLTDNTPHPTAVQSVYAAAPSENCMIQSSHVVVSGETADEIWKTYFCGQPGTVSMCNEPDTALTLTNSSSWTPAWHTIYPDQEICFSPSEK